MDEKAQVYGEVEQNNISQLEQIPEHLMSNWLNFPAFWEKYHVLTKFSLFSAKLAILGILVLLTTLIARERVARVAQTIQVDFWRSMGFGVLIEILILPVFILLCVSCIGIPFIPIAIIILLIAIIMVYSTASFIIGGKVCPQTVPQLVSVLLGFLLLHSFIILAQGIHFIGWLDFGIKNTLVLINFLVIWLFITVGLGAVWITRFGGKLSIGVPIMPCSASMLNTLPEQPKGKEKEVEYDSTLNK